MRWKSHVRFGRRSAETDRSKDRYRDADRPHTKLAGPVKGQYFDAYVMIDIYSRMIVGVHVHHSESAVLAVDMMKQIFKIHGNPQVVHADRGTSMTSKLVAALLADLQVTQSHSRPGFPMTIPLAKRGSRR